MTKLQLKRILTDIRFWLIFLFVLRLIGITNAPLEIGHNWRQCLTNMVTRNFMESGVHMFHPMIDMAGAKTGIIGSEFPFFNYLVYLFSSIFDYSHWHGRLINLIISSIGLYYFFKLIRDLFNQQVAFNSTIVLSVSIWFAFSRKIMPDTFSAALVIIGLYFAYKFLKTGYKSSLLFFFLLCTLGMLCKIPALSLFSVLALVVFMKEINLRRKISLCITATISFAIVCLWYFYWVPHLLETYGYQLYFPKSFAVGIEEIKPLLWESFEKFYFVALHSYVAFTFVLVGIVLLIKNKQKHTLMGIGIISLVFFVFIIKTGGVFPMHSYYIIPFSPVMAFIAGYAISKIPLRFQYILLVFIAIEGIANQQHDFRVKDSHLYRLELDAITEKYIPSKDLIIINGGPSPQDIYFAHRKGWSVENEDLLKPQLIDSLSKFGANYLIVNTTSFDQQFSEYKTIYQDEHYSIYGLQK